MTEDARHERHEARPRRARGPGGPAVPSLELRFRAELQEKVNELFFKLVVAMLASQATFASVIVAFVD